MSIEHSIKLHKAILEAEGYIDLCLMCERNSKNYLKMKQKAIDALAIMNDDEFVDKLYDDDMKNDNFFDVT